MPSTRLFSLGKRAKVRGRPEHLQTSTILFPIFPLPPRTRNVFQLQGVTAGRASLRIFAALIQQRCFSARHIPLKEKEKTSIKFPDGPHPISAPQHTIVSTPDPPGPSQQLPADVHRGPRSQQRARWTCSWRQCRPCSFLLQSCENRWGFSPARILSIYCSISGQDHLNNSKRRCSRCCVHDTHSSSARGVERGRTTGT